MRFAELFAGAGGLSLGLERAGHECVWHAEWADAPRQVLKHHWPDVPLYGNVSMRIPLTLAERKRLTRENRRALFPSVALERYEITLRQLEAKLRDRAAPAQPRSEGRE